MKNDFYTVNNILKEISSISFGKNVYKEMFNIIKNKNRIFITGQGRSGLVGKMFTMRLVHLGFTVYNIGDVVTPSIEKGDLLIICSASGETQKPIIDAKTAKEIGAEVLLLTSNGKSRLASLSNYIVNLSQNDLSTKQYGGSLFEQALLILLDSLVSYIQKELKITNKDMDLIHTNLE